MRSGVGCKSKQVLAMIQNLPALLPGPVPTAYLKAVPEAGQTLVLSQSMGFPVRNLSLMLCHERIDFLLRLSCLGCRHCFSFLQHSVGQSAHDHPAGCDVASSSPQIRILGCLVKVPANSGLP